MAPEPRTPREFAVWVAARLTESGHEALWAGGCVRDALLGKEPKDFDVATSARPDEVVQIFGRRRTVMVGAAFGVVVVTSPVREAGQVEVATFRTDGEYTDGRRPDDVRFCSSREDALRRDFTINGMFYDPVKDVVLDYVNGEEDLKNGVVRAIGDATARFTEDRLRMLRAVRFTATLGFELDSTAFSAVQAMAASVRSVSVERIAQEMRRMLAHPHRLRALRLLQETGLLPYALPPGNSEGEWDSGVDSVLPEELSRLSEASFETAAALLCRNLFRPAAVASHIDDEVPAWQTVAETVFRRWRLSNEETKRIAWLVAESVRWDAMETAPPHHVAKPVAAHPDWPLIADLLNASQISIREPDASPVPAGDWLRTYRSGRSADQLNPPVLLDGERLQDLGIPPGPRMGRIMKEIRKLQLDEKLGNRSDAEAWVMQRTRECDE